MRKLLLILLLGGASAPAFAAPEESRDDDRPRSERPARAERAEPAPRRAEPQPTRSEPAERRPMRVERDRPASAPVERPQIRASRGSDTPADAAPRRRVPVQDRIAVERARPADSVRDWRAVERHRDDSPSSIEERNLRRAPIARPDSDLVEQKRALPPVMDREPRRRVSRTPLPGTEPPAPVTASRRDAEPQHRWGSNWRRDKRYDWRDHRKRNKWKFHLGFYYDPFGWNYHRYGIGWRLWPSHYGSRFWLHDPWSYRLPPAYGPYRWIRYWDDALLVNIYTGQVVDVIYDFFW